MLGTRESMHALSKRILGLVVKATDKLPQATLYLDGNPVRMYVMSGPKFGTIIEIEGFSYFLEVELEDSDIGIYTCFLHLYKQSERGAFEAIVTDHFLIIQDVSQTFDPDKVTQHWDVLVVERANINVHVCDLYKPMNRMQAEAQASRYRPSGSQQMLVEGIEKVSAIPINADGEEIEL